MPHRTLCTALPSNLVYSKLSTYTDLEVIGILELPIGYQEGGHHLSLCLPLHSPLPGLYKDINYLRTPPLQVPLKLARIWGSAITYKVNAETQFPVGRCVGGAASDAKAFARVEHFQLE